MIIPFRIMMAVSTFFALLIGVLGVLFWRGRRAGPGRNRWALANLLYALCLLLLTLRPVVPDWLGVVGANALLAAATVLCLEATREYRNLRPRVSAAYAGGIVAVLAVAYCDYILRDLNARVFAMSAFTGVMAAICSVTLLKDRRAPGRVVVMAVGGAFGLSAVLLLVRAVYFLLAPPLSDAFTPNPVGAGLFVGCALSVACCSIGWTHLIGERVKLDLDDAESNRARASREMAEALERAHHMAQRAAEADAARSSFVATVDHEIRNPLGYVIAATDLLLDTELTPEQRACTRAVLAGAETMLRVKDDLSDLSEIEAGNLVLESSPFDLLALIEDAAKTYAVAAKEKGIDLVVSCPAGFPSLFSGDAGKLRRVIMHLLGNAVRFTSSGQVLVSVACELRDPYHPQVRISVTDSGTGIPPETLQSLFERSSQGPPWASKIPGGAGIGFLVSNKLIELMGGRLHVESRVGEGSTFWFTLPLAK